jgi:ATP-binding cassette subfamily G (WHITE) protein 2
MQVASPENALTVSSDHVTTSDVELGWRPRADTYTPNAPVTAPTMLTFANLNVRSRKNPEKYIIRDANGAITGGFWAIMGSSGSGKTTLLSTLSRRLDTKFMEITGDIRLNGKEYSNHTLKEMSAYVMQDDLVHADLTVGETLSYAAHLRLPARNDRQAEVLKLMGITHCLNTIVGNTIRKGISGGERKRLCIAVEILVPNYYFWTNQLQVLTAQPH